MIYTGNNAFYYSLNAFNPLVLKMKSYDGIGIVHFYEPIGPSYSSSGKLEVCIAHPYSGLVLLEENISVKRLYNEE